MKFISDEASLQHFGIPGMKWGQRKAKSQPSKRSIKTDAKTVLKLNRKYELSAGKNLLAPNAKNKLGEEQAFKKYSDFVNSRETALGKNYVKAIFDKANEGRYEVDY